MTSKDEWGPWIEHDGRGCPLQVGTIFQGETRVMIHSPEMLTEIGKKVWDEVEEIASERGLNGYGILRYRIRKPRGLTMLENLITELP